MVASLEEIGVKIIDSGAVEIRDVDEGDEPFVYSTGNRGPGYLMIKGLVGQRKIMKFLTLELARKIAPLYLDSFEIIEGNATGGMVPAWQLTDDVEKLLELEEGTIPYCYLRGSRKEGGHGELITGDARNPLIRPGMKVLVFEELVNYAGTTGNAAEEFRAAGYPVSHAACILHYDNPEANQNLKNKGITLVSLITLPEILDISESKKLIPIEAIQSYRDFLQNPIQWQLQRNLVIPTQSAERAIDEGIGMRGLSKRDALALGAPEGKLNEGVVYWTKDN